MILAIANLKGGSTRTTTAMLLACAFTRMGDLGDGGQQILVDRVDTLLGGVGLDGLDLWPEDEKNRRTRR